LYEDAETLQILSYDLMNLSKVTKTPKPAPERFDLFLLVKEAFGVVVRLAEVKNL